MQKECLWKERRKQKNRTWKDFTTTSTTNHNDNGKKSVFTNWKKLKWDQRRKLPFSIMCCNNPKSKIQLHRNRYFVRVFFLSFFLSSAFFFCLLCRFIYLFECWIFENHARWPSEWKNTRKFNWNFNGKTEEKNLHIKFA